MEKIKSWKKIVNQEDRIEWWNERKGIVVILQSSEDIHPHGWGAFVEKEGKYLNEIEFNETRSVAYRSAIRFMKKNRV